MNNTIRNNNNVTDVRNLRIQHQNRVKPQAAPETSFAELLKKTEKNSNAIRFSKHAKERIASRNIKMTEGTVNSLQKAISQARAKGAEETVVIGKNGAFIVSVKNNMVITGLSADEMKNNIFTNIDSAVLI